MNPPPTVTDEYLFWLFRVAELVEQLDITMRELQEARRKLRAVALQRAAEEAA